VNNKLDEFVPRFSLTWRLQHLLLMLGVTGLAISGLAYRYYATPFGRFLIGIEGGFGSRGILHRICGVMLGLAVIWHGYKVIFTRAGHDDFMELMPAIADWDRWKASLRAKIAGRPIEGGWGRYTLGQKAQYWTVAVGTLFMICTGLILLMGERAVAALPKWIVDLIRVVHGGQGVELMIFIVLWHLYSTHFSPGRFPMDMSWITGRISRQQLKAYHQKEYQRLFPEDV